MMQLTHPQQSVSRPTAYDWIVFFLIGYVLVFALGIPFVLRIPRHEWYLFWQNHVVILLASSIILVVAVVQNRQINRRQVLYAAALLVISNTLAIFGSIFNVSSFKSPVLHGLPVGLSIYIVSFIVGHFSLSALIPVTIVRQIAWFRMQLDALLSLAVIGLLIEIGLPYVIPGWQATPLVIACAFRLEVDLGLLVWYAFIIFRFGAVTRRAVWCFGIGALCMIVTDIMFIIANVQIANHGTDTLLFYALPVWDMHHLLWAVGIVAISQKPILWKQHGDDGVGLLAQPWQSSLRQGGIVVLLMIVIVTIKSSQHVITFLLAVLCRESWLGYERTRFVHTQRELQATILSRSSTLERVEYNRERETTAAVHDIRHELRIIEAAVVKGQVQGADIGSLFQPARDVVNDMLLASQLRGNALDLYPTCTDMATLITDVVHQLQPMFQQAACVVHLHVPENHIIAWCDGPRISRVIKNILHNALIYTTDYRLDAHISVSLTVDATMAFCRVVDNGPGMNEAEIEKLGTRFVRLRSGAERPDGAGIGLAFCARLIALSQGNLMITSDGLGCGTTVTIALPLPRETQLL